MLLSVVSSFLRLLAAVGGGALLFFAVNVSAFALHVSFATFAFDIVVVGLMAGSLAIV